MNYLNLQVTERDSFSLRNEFMNDMNGQRTGTATRYYGIGASWTHYFKQNVFVRPELVYYQAMDNPAFQQGTKFTQLVAAVDFIIRF